MDPTPHPEHDDCGLTVRCRNDNQADFDNMDGRLPLFGPSSVVVEFFLRDAALLAHQITRRLL